VWHGLCQGEQQFANPIRDGVHAVLEQTDDVPGRAPGENGETTGEAPIEDRPATPCAHAPVVLLNDIRDLAFRKWQAAGCPSAGCAHFWLEAEEELQQAR
jgi:hypothetical protein